MVEGGEGSGPAVARVARSGDTKVVALLRRLDRVEERIAGLRPGRARTVVVLIGASLSVSLVGLLEVVGWGVVGLLAGLFLAGALTPHVRLRMLERERARILAVLEE